MDESDVQQVNEFDRKKLGSTMKVGSDEKSELEELEAEIDPLVALSKKVVSDKIMKLLLFKNSRTGDEQINVKEFAG